jgi:cytoskeletal protein CcmA (bactofilin family)
MFGNKKSELSSAAAESDTVEVPIVVTATLEKNRNETRLPSPLGKKKSQSNGEPSVLSAGAVFKGILSSPGPVHAQGKLEGELTSPHVTLGDSGQMSGKLTCRNLVIDGKFNGELECDEAVAGATSVMEGVLICKSLQAAPGAQISGKVQIGEH